MKVNWKIRYLTTLQHPKKSWDICKTFFSDFGCNFFLLGGVFHKCSKSKYQSIHQNKFFDTHFVCEKHPLHNFCFFPLLACLHFLKLFCFPIFGELSKLRAKFFMCWMKIDREIIFQSWLLCDCFYTQMSQLPHSALSTPGSLKKIRPFEIYRQYIRTGYTRSAADIWKGSQL